METPLFCMDEACRELKISKEIYCRILKKAFEQTSGDLEKLRTAHSSGDVATIQAISHRLKGDYANLRITALSKIAEELNILAKGDYAADKVFELMNTFVDMFNTIKNISE